MRRVVEMTDYFFVIEYDTGKKNVEFHDSKDELLFAIAQIYSFDDPWADSWAITKIICEGKSCYFTGRQPGMIFEFVDDDGQVIWRRQFPQWIR